VRHTQLLRTCAALVLAAALAACSDGTGAEEPLNDVYVLTTVDGASNPIVIADHTYPSGTRQVYMVEHDSLVFTSATTMDRRLTTAVATLGPDGAPITGVLQLRYEFRGQALRRGKRLIVNYAPAQVPLSPDTFRLRDGNLVRQGPYGVSCDGCAPSRSVEYVYGPR
jgi:hypothetical protein